jgi:hypothetical protein
LEYFLLKVYLQWVPADQEDHNSFSNKEFNTTSLAVAAATVVMGVGEALQLSADGEVSVDFQL